MEHSQFEFLCMFYTKGEEERWIGGGVLVIHLKTSLYRNNTCILLVKFVIVIVNFWHFTKDNILCV